MYPERGSKARAAAESESSLVVAGYYYFIGGVLVPGNLGEGG
jgi:hypothetical protein